MQTYQSFEERFCPVVGRNIAMEVSFGENQDRCTRCLNEYQCVKTYGKCTNVHLNPQQEVPKL